MFKNRRQAGSLLAQRLSFYKNKKDTLILGVPRGGVLVAKEVSNKLNLPLDVLIVRKIGAPGNQELALGAVGEGNNMFLDRELVSALKVKKSDLSEKIDEKKREVKKRERLFRKGKKRVSVNKKTVIVVDDGIATGSTIKVALNCLKEEKPGKIILAIPVCPKSVAEELREMVEKTVFLKTPEDFYAVGQFYNHFPQVQDKEVASLLN